MQTYTFLCTRLLAILYSMRLLQSHVIRHIIGHERQDKKKTPSRFIHLVELICKKHGADESLLGVPVLEVPEGGATGASGEGVLPPRSSSCSFFAALLVVASADAPVAGARGRFATVPAIRSVALALVALPRARSALAAFPVVTAAGVVELGVRVAALALVAVAAVLAVFAAARCSSVAVLFHVECLTIHFFCFNHGRKHKKNTRHTHRKTQTHTHTQARRQQPTIAIIGVVRMGSVHRVR